MSAHLGRNEPCPCGSGKRYKHCCGSPLASAPRPAAAPAQNLGPHEVSALLLLIQQRRFQEAEERALSLLSSHPEAGMLWKILSVVLLQQGKDALPALRRAVQLLPQDAEVLSNLGSVLASRRLWTEALARLSRALELHPEDGAALLDAANALRALGRTRESVPFYRRALQLDPRSPEAHNNLGNALMQLGQCSDAVVSYGLALQSRPDDAQLLCNLGNALRELGRLQEALGCSERALALDPQLSMAHNNLGLCLTGLGRREQAVASYRRALELQPDYVEALNNLGTLLPELGGLREAMQLLRRAIELDPARAESHRNLANVVFEFRRFEEAAASYRQALALQPQNALAHAGLGAALRMQGHTQQAEACCRAALAIDPKCVSALSLLGELRADRGQFAEAEQLFREVIALDPGFPFAFYSIAMNRKMTRADGSWLQGAEALLAKPLPLRHEISLRYALGKYFDDTQEYARAFDSFKAANELTKRYAVSYDRAQVTARVERVTRRFDAHTIRHCQSGADQSERPVFIVGMPRSGTSLTEQILASHPAVYGAGELAFWQTSFASYEAAELKGEDGTSLLPGMARDYLARLRSLSADAQRVVDKMPLNFLNLGQICAALPRARIIHVRRHPIDTCLSIYFHYFSRLHPYANDFENLAHYYREYVRIMDHWRAVLPETTLLEVPYEGLIADQEGWTRRMLDFIALPWDAKCLEFERTDRVVITLSKWQVRQKIHASSVERWRHYEAYVAPLLPLLEFAAPAQPLTRSELGS